MLLQSEMEDAPSRRSILGNLSNTSYMVCILFIYFSLNNELFQKYNLKHKQQPSDVCNTQT